MDRPPVSIVIPVWNAWPFTKLCLESLRPTLGVRDEIIVVDNGSSDATARELRKLPGLTVLTNDTNLGFAHACNQGAAAAKHEIIIFLNNDTIVTRGWIEELVAPFSDETVGATGPRSNSVSGEQIVDSASYSTNGSRELRQFARDWTKQNYRRTSTTQRLVGFCIAIRRSAFDQVGGWDERYEVGGFEDDDLCRGLIENGWELKIAHGAFIHHHGSRTFAVNKLDQSGIQERNASKYVDKFAGATLISACIIVRDEADNIADCIASVEGFVDEVVVYDTGSTDATVHIARKAGATVVVGYWNDDFGAARNRALASCAGTWILQIDADERLEVKDPATLRTHLMSSVDAMLAMAISITNYDDAIAGGDVVHNAVRLFVREKFHWSGRLHERVERRDGIGLGRVALEPSLRLHHFGYRLNEIVSRNKIDRNIRIAEIDLADAPHNSAEKHLSLARSLLMTTRAAEAFQHLELAWTACSVESSTRSVVNDILRSGVESLLVLGQYSTALDWVSRLESEFPDDKNAVHYLRAQALFGAGEFDAAVNEYEKVDESAEKDNPAFSRAKFWFRSALAYEKAGREVRSGDAFVEALKLGYKNPIWPKLSHERAFELSTQLRAAGFAEACPLIAMSGDVSYNSTIRIQAAAIAANVFGDERGSDHVRNAVIEVDDIDLVPVLSQLIQLAPVLVRPFLESGASTPERAIVLADVMSQSGAEESALELRAHAVDLREAAAGGDTRH